MLTKPFTPNQISNTSGGAYVAGDVNIQSGDFVGRDQINIFLQFGNSMPSMQEFSIDEEKWNEIAHKYAKRVYDRYNSVRILGNPRSLLLDHIFTDVYLLDRPQAYARHNIEQLNQTQPQSLIERHNGLEFIRNSHHRRIFVFGKPGSGKTTFLRYLALKVTQGEISQLPILVTLRDWWESEKSLPEFITHEFEICGVPHSALFVEQLLQSGKSLILFDGLDEINIEGQSRNKAISTLKEFADKYAANQILISCRNAAITYSFEQFEYVEVADFTAKQVDLFAANWFGRDSDKHKNFLTTLNASDHKSVRDLSRNPLLLSLLCLVFESTDTFPQKRADLYREALDGLLKTWDATRSIKRDDIYHGLSHRDKEHLLKYIAYTHFEQEQLFIEQDVLTSQIETYLKTFKSNPLVEYESDGDVILKAIEAQHGLLVERAYHIYSFSHLTFQEYFTAKHICDQNQTVLFEQLCTQDRLCNDRWREVFLLTASMLRDPTPLFDYGIQELHAVIKREPNLIRLLNQAQNSANRISKSNADITQRILHVYLSIALDRNLTALNIVKQKCFDQIDSQASVAAINELDIDIDSHLRTIRDSQTSLAQAFAIDRAILAQMLQLAGLPEKQVFELNLDDEFEMLNSFDFDDPVIISWLINYTFQLVAILATLDISDPQAIICEQIDFNIGQIESYFYKVNDVEIQDALASLRTPETSKQIDWKIFYEQVCQIFADKFGLYCNFGMNLANLKTLDRFLQANQLLLDCLAVAPIQDKLFVESRLFTLSKT